MSSIDWAEMGSWVGTVALAIGLAAVAGIRAWLPLLITGLLARFGLVHVGHSFEFVSTTPALVLFGLATIVEIAGDKIPAIDHTLDVAGTFVRPVAGALLAAAAMYQIESPLYACVAGLIIGAPTALVPHATKAVARAASTTFTAGLANPLLSLAEDGLAIGMLVLAILIPVLFVVAFVIGVVATLYVIRKRRPMSAKPELRAEASAA